MSAEPESELASEQELVELFRPRRSDPEAFRRGVERKLAEQGAAGRSGERAAPASTVPAWLRRAAALVPGDFAANAGDLAGGALGGAAVGKLAGAKLLPAALALPALLFGSAIGAFAASARSMRRSARTAAPFAGEPKGWQLRPPLNKDLFAGSVLQELLSWSFLLAVLAAPLLGGSWAIDGVLLLLLLSMGSLALSVRGFASAGMLGRTQVTKLCFSMLVTLLGSCLIWVGGFHIPDAASSLGLGAASFVLLLGIPAVLLAGGKDRAPRFGWIGAAGMAVVFVALNLGGWTRSSPGALREQLAAIELDPGDLWNWEAAAALHHAVVALDAPPPDLSHVQARVAEALESGVEGHPTSWDCALRMGLVDAEHRALLAERPLVRRRLEALRGGAPSTYIRFEGYLFELLRDEARGDPALRERLATSLEAAWPEPGEHGPLRDAHLVVRELDAIGAPERADALRAKAHALLVSHWTGSSSEIFASIGGFTSDPVKFETSFDDDTWDAVRLMERLGAPPEIDLRLLRGHLRSESRVEMFDTMFELNAESRASLRVLEDVIGLPPRGPLQRILDERLLVAALLLVGLCVLAIRLTPSVREDAGALP